MVCLQLPTASFLLLIDVLLVAVEILHFGLAILSQNRYSFAISSADIPALQSYHNGRSSSARS